jgi:hypothetical protein
VRLSLAGLALPLLILVIGGWIASTSSLPQIFAPTMANEQAAGSLFVTASGNLGSMAVALLVGCALLLQLRERRNPDLVDWSLALAATALALLSIFAGFRFQIDVATQLSVYHLDVSRIIRGLHFQGIFLLISASLLTALTVDRLGFGQDVVGPS